MRSGGPLAVRLYPKDLADSTLQMDVTTQVSNLRWETQLHGGFTKASFHLVCGTDQAWLWYNRLAIWKRLVISENASVWWEGEVQRAELIKDGVDVAAFGYWASLRNIPHMNYAGATPAVFTYNANEHADDIIKDVLTQSCPLISADQSNIDDPGLIVATAADPLSWDDKYPQDIIIDLAPIGDNVNYNPWWFAVWEGRVPWFKEQVLTQVNWMVRMADFTPAGFRMIRDIGEFASGVYALYRAAGILTRTATATDAAVESDNRRKVVVVSDLGEVDAAVATTKRDTELLRRKNIQQVGQMEIQGTVMDTYGKPCPLWRVRAGQVIRVVDLVPASAGLTTVVADKLSTFYIRHTAYDVDGNTLRIEPETLGPNLARQLSEGGLA